MERIIHLTIVRTLESKHLISDSQNGFRHKSSTVALFDCASCLKLSELLNLAKAFNIPHYLDLNALIGIRGNFTYLV